jgi:hypothetical protein
MNFKAASYCCAAASFFVLPALAHHSTAMFDQTKTLVMTGTVKELEWINPHAWLHVVIVDSEGKSQTWSFEGGATTQLTALGWRPDSLKPGDKAIVGYRPMKDGSRGGQLMNVTLPNGQKVCSNRGCG